MTGCRGGFDPVDIVVNEVRVMRMAGNEVRLIGMAVKEVMLIGMAVKEVRLIGMAVKEVRLMDMGVNVNYSGCQRLINLIVAEVIG